MKRIRVIHRLRTAVALLGFAVVVAAAAILWWANHTGLPDSWRAGIEQALAPDAVKVWPGGEQVTALGRL